MIRAFPQGTYNEDSLGIGVFANILKKYKQQNILYLGFWCRPNIVRVHGKFDLFSTKPFQYNKFLFFPVCYCVNLKVIAYLEQQFGSRPCDMLSGLHSTSLSPTAGYVNLLHCQILPNKQSFYGYLFDIFVDIKPDFALLFLMEYQWNKHHSGVRTAHSSYSTQISRSSQSSYQQIRIIFAPLFPWEGTSGAAGRPESDTAWRRRDGGAGAPGRRSAKQAGFHLHVDFSLFFPPFSDSHRHSLHC